jgi:hypothetical protein
VELGRSLMLAGSGGSGPLAHPSVPGRDHCLHPRLDTKLLEDARDVNLRRLLADDQAPGDLPVAEPLAKKGQDLGLSRRKRGEPAVLTRPTGDPLRLVSGGNHDHQEHRLLHRYGSISTVVRPLINWA